MKPIFTSATRRKIQLIFLSGFFVLCFQSSVVAQLGIYTFTGSGNCPNQDPSVTMQPANAVFSDMTNTNADCDDADNVFRYKKWNSNTSIDLSEYNEFTVTANSSYSLTLTSLSFKQDADEDPSSGVTTWALRSSIDNYASNIATGIATTPAQTPIVTLNPASFTNINSVNFRFYVIHVKGNGTRWTMDNVTLNGMVSSTVSVVLPANPASLTSNSPQCDNPGVTISYTGTAPAGETWYWQTTPGGTSTANSASSYIVNTSGTYYLRSQSDATLAWSAGAASITVTVTPNVGTPVFAAGSNSVRCQGLGNVTYAATGSNSTGLNYSLDAASLAGGNIINSATGQVTYDAAWLGTSVITVTASGCNGPVTSSHTAVTKAVATAPVFAVGNSSTRCSGSGSVIYTATANSSVIYSLDAGSAAAGNTIDSTTGEVTYTAGWAGTSTITATVSDCTGALTDSHVVTITPSVGAPVFSLGTTTTRCQGNGTVTYTVTASNNTGIIYNLDAPSLAGGATINSSNGMVTYPSMWTGNSTITATASGCNGPVASSHTVVTNTAATAPVFTMGSSSTRCSGSGSVIYTATANSSVIYSLDAGSTASGNTINAATGAVTYTGAWSGTSTITATVAGCAGPLTDIHTVTITASVGTPVFASGTTSTRCQGSGTVIYSAAAPNNTGIIYSLDAPSLAGGLIINPSTGSVNYPSAWAGNSIITATASGCNGPVSANHSVIITAAIGTPVFVAGSSSTRCLGAGSITYTATSLNSTGLTYSLDGLSLVGGNTINSTSGKVTFAALWIGSSTITTTATGCGGPITATHTVTITGTVATPAFTNGSTSTRCQGAATVTYTANANNNSGITYNLDAASVTGGNTINSSTGDLMFAAGWSGTTTITATATGCGGPKTSNHTITVTPSVGTPVFTSGAASTRCQGSGTTTYSASVTNSTGKTYGLDAASLAGGNTINSTSGAVTYSNAWSGTSVITVSANGCNGPVTASHTVTVTPTVSAPVFLLGNTSSRCQGTGTLLYDAIASNSTSITYSLNAAALSGGNSITASSGSVMFASSWAGSTIITATAVGCNGPKTATHTVAITPTVGTPVFVLGATSSRCQGANMVTYTADATNNTGITYSLDAASISGGNTINAATGQVTYAAGWTGTSSITASANGCNGPKTATHAVTINSTVGVATFNLGATSTRCQGTGSVTYTATCPNATSYSYALDAASMAGGNTINNLTGVVVYASGWSGTTTITALASGCSGPVSAVHTVTVTPTVGTPLFTLGATSVRCQGTGTVTYTAAATNATGITYTLDAASIAAGNTINSSTGAVTYVNTWTTTSTITATAAGCNGPKTSSHAVTMTATVGAPVFVRGQQSVRSQGAASITYTASASNSTGIIYSLDAASISGGNTINASSGAVMWTAGWYGVSVVTATANGCNGPSAASHIINVNPSIVQSPLYLSGPGQILDRIDPVSTGITTTLQTADLSSSATTNITFSLSPVLCSDLTIKAQTIAVVLHLSITSGTMPASPSISALIKYGSTNIINLTNPVYNSATGVLTWSGVLGSDVTVPSGQPIELEIITAQAGAVFKISYHSAAKPSRISLLPVSTFIDFSSFAVYNAPYPNGSIRTSGNMNTPYYARATVTTPFGYKDITGLDLKINPPGNTIAVTCVDSSACSRTYEYPWTTSGSTGVTYLLATAKEGYENIIKNSGLLAFDVCSVCPPVAGNDSAMGAGGTPLILNVLVNDYDPNNNIKLSTLAILTQPNNGTGFVSNNKVVYLPNGTYAGKDTLVYQICDSTGLCATAKAFFTINPLLIDPCSDATKTHTYFIPYSEKDAYIALLASSNTTMPSNNIRTVISLTMPYPGMTVVWDEWEDGYELNPWNPLQTTTKVWGDGNPYNGIAPGYATDIIPAGGSIVLDNTMPANPRVQSNIFYDGRDKITASGQVSITQVCGEPTRMPVQSIKTNVTSTYDFGQSFTIPLGQNYPSQDFKYTALFIRAELNNTVVDIDKDNNGTFETNFTLNQGESYLVNGGVSYGATVTSTKPVGVELNAGGIDQYSIRNAPIYPATWYSNTYFTPVPTSDNSGDNPKDSSVVMLYNSLNRPLVINWNSGAPANGTINLPAKGCVRFPLAYSTSAAYKFYNAGGESFTAIEIVDSYTPVSGGNDGSTYDWSFNLISESRLTDFATTAWAPGGLDLVAPPGPDVNGNPIWITPNMNTTIYVKWDGKVSGNTGLLSPCGLRYDVSYSLNALNYIKLRDMTDNDQSGLAVYTCNGAKIAAVYGEDPQGSTTGIGIAYWDVGTTIMPFCKQKLIFANDDYGRTLINQPVTIPVLLNDFGFLAVVDPTSVTNTALLQPSHGTIFINSNGTIIYTPNPGYVGKDTFEYNVCSTPTPIVCDIAAVYVDISTCPAPFNANIIIGNVFLDQNGDGISNEGGTGVPGAKVYLYVDGNCNASIDANELKDSVTVDASGTYQFVTYPEKFVEDDFDDVSGARTCNNGSDGNAAWLSNWVDAGDVLSSGYCNNSQSVANTDCDIIKDGAFTNAIRLKDNNVSATRTVNLSGASYAFLSFSYRRKSATLTAGEDVIVQASKDGSTFGTVFTISGDGTTDPAYVPIYNQDITAYANSTTYIRFLTNSNVDDADTVYIDDVKVQFLRYPQCYMTRLDSTTIPAYHHKTTVLQYAFTATSAQTCLSPYNFGVAKNMITISGTLFQDANGIKDNLVNGTAIGVVAGVTVYAYLIDSTAKVVKRTTLAANGTYTFTNADVLTKYRVCISTISVNLGDPTPTSAGISSLAGSWVNTGDAYGTNNVAGSGIKAGAATASVLVTTGISNVTNVNFGIEKLPDSDDKTVSYAINTPSILYNVPGLTGTDPEDGVLGTGKTFKITSLPASANLFYNFAQVTLNQVITSFNANLLKIDPDDGIISTFFTYASMDAAGMFDPTPATVRVNWVTLLPIKLLDFTGKYDGTKVNLYWSTSSEENSSHFEVERGFDGQSFRLMTKVNAAGFSNQETNYSAIDPSPEKGWNYYRLKMVDKDGKYVYSKIVAIENKTGASLDTRVMPNPFTGKLDIYLTLTKASDVVFKFLDVSGKTVYTKTVQGAKGYNWFIVNDLEKLPSTPYILYVITDEKTFTEKLIKQ